MLIVIFKYIFIFKINYIFKNASSYLDFQNIKGSEFDLFIVIMTG